MGLVQLPLLLILFSKREATLSSLSFIPHSPLSLFYDYRYLLLFLCCRVTYTLKWYLVHLPVLSLPVSPLPET